MIEDIIVLDDVVSIDIQNKLEDLVEQVGCGDEFNSEHSDNELIIPITFFKSCFMAF